jgi:excisionase family DNA binding protein
MEKKEKSFMTIQETAEYLGIKVSTVYNYTHRRIIPFYKPRRKIYFKIKDLDNFILNEENHYKSESEIEAEALQHIVRTS